MSLTIEQLLQGLQISGSPTSDSSTESRQLIDIQCPPKQRYAQHYGYRVNLRYLLDLESQIKSDPDVFYNPTSLARRWIKRTLQLPQFDFKCCIDPERRKPDDVLECDKDLYRFGDEDEDEDEVEVGDEDECVILILSVCSNGRSSFNTRPTQEQMTSLTNLLGSPPQWWVSYRNM
ncbi:hypothetical protein DFH29DRAFT_996469 [Suillus ampliporus]|nr:hypothetical protein DFH29DRAFT_996469 [Suillus ampliporus]